MTVMRGQVAMLTLIAAVCWSGSRDAHASPDALPVFAERSIFHAAGSAYGLISLPSQAVLETTQWDRDLLGDSTYTALHGYPSVFDARIKTEARAAALILQDVSGERDFEFVFVHYNSRVDRCTVEPCPGLEQDRPVLSTAHVEQGSAVTPWRWTVPAGVYAVALLTDPPHVPATAEIRLTEGTRPGSVRRIPLDLLASSASLSNVFGDDAIAGPAEGALSAVLPTEGIALASYTVLDEHYVDAPLTQSDYTLELCLNLDCNPKLTSQVIGGRYLTFQKTRFVQHENLSMDWRYRPHTVVRHSVATLMAWPRVVHQA